MYRPQHFSASHPGPPPSPPEPALPPLPAAPPSAKQRLALERSPYEVFSDGRGGLTYSKETCAAANFDYPCYAVRGRYEDQPYLSIEALGAYDGFAPRRFVVIAASGDRDSEEFQAVLEKARRANVPVLVRKWEVYMGCMH